MEGSEKESRNDRDSDRKREERCDGRDGQWNEVMHGERRR